MTRNAITIRNLYVMMAYAFRAIRSEGQTDAGSEQFERVHDLLAELLVRGVGAQVKRGLHRDYQRYREEIPTVRGRIDVGRSIASRSTSRGRLVCDFDEYEPDTPHNRALKAVIVLLIRHGDVTVARRDALRRLLPHFEAVTLVAPRSIRWDALTYHRANAAYRLLLGVCELVVRGLLPTRETGPVKLTSWLSEEAMSRLYERFLREYYLFHHRNLSVGAPLVEWAIDDPGAGSAQLPSMRTDVTLRNRRRTLIIDAKYYGESMQISPWGKKTVHSSNLYQVFTYVKNEDARRDGSVSGLLLYARTDAAEQPDLDVRIQGNRIGARTLDLGLPWESIRNQLEDVVTWLDD